MDKHLQSDLKAVTIWKTVMTDDAVYILMCLFVKLISKLQVNKTVSP
jgi:hypothetical protein